MHSALYNNTKSCTSTSRFKPLSKYFFMMMQLPRHIIFFATLWCWIRKIYAQNITFFREIYKVWKIGYANIVLMAFRHWREPLFTVSTTTYPFASKQTTKTRMISILLCKCSRNRFTFNYWSFKKLFSQFSATQKPAILRSSQNQRYYRE